MNEKVETKKEKKTEHTRMYAQLCSSTNEIFTSVVVYSRTTKPYPITHQKQCFMVNNTKMRDDWRQF